MRTEFFRADGQTGRHACMHTWQSKYSPFAILITCLKMQHWNGLQWYNVCTVLSSCFKTFNDWMRTCARAACDLLSFPSYFSSSFSFSSSSWSQRRKNNMLYWEWYSPLPTLGVVYILCVQTTSSCLSVCPSVSKLVSATKPFVRFSLS